MCEILHQTVSLIWKIFSQIFSKYLIMSTVKIAGVAMGYRSEWLSLDTADCLHMEVVGRLQYEWICRCFVKVIWTKWRVCELLGVLIHQHLTGPVYTEHQSQHCDNSAIMLVILFSLKTMESLQNGLQPISSDAIVFNENSMASVITELSQYWRWCLV